jgi:hypothetical protein
VRPRQPLVAGVRSGVSWSLVISVTAGRESTPLAVVGTAGEQRRGEGEVVLGGRGEPAARPSNVGGRLHRPSAPSSRTGSPVTALSRSYAVANRSMLSAPTLKAVSFIPSGSQLRSRRAAPKDMPVARAMSTPVTLAAVSYSQRSPGWWTSGSAPNRRIHSSGGALNVLYTQQSAIGTVPGSAGTIPLPRV